MLTTAQRREAERLLPKIEALARAVTKNDEDLVADAYVYLCEGIEKFDDRPNYTLESFVKAYVRGKLRNAKKRRRYEVARGLAAGAEQAVRRDVYEQRKDIRGAPQTLDELDFQEGTLPEMDAAQAAEYRAEEREAILDKKAAEIVAAEDRRAEAHRLLAAVIEMLPAKLRSYARARWLYGLTVAEIAEEHEVTARWVISRLQQAEEFARLHCSGGRGHIERDRR